MSLTPAMRHALRSPPELVPGVGYRELNITTMQNVVALQLMKRCGLQINEDRLQLAIGYLRKCSDAAPGICYSHHQLVANPVNGDGSETGFNPTYSSIFAICLALLGEQDSRHCQRSIRWFSNPENQRFTRFGHAETHFSLFWNPAAMARLNPVALIEYDARMREDYTLRRMHDGSFTHLPIHEEVAAKGSISRNFGRAWPTGWMALVLAQGIGKLSLSGNPLGVATESSLPLRQAAWALSAGNAPQAQVHLETWTNTILPGEGQFVTQRRAMADYIHCRIHERAADQSDSRRRLE